MPWEQKCVRETTIISHWSETKSPYRLLIRISSDVQLFLLWWHRRAQLRGHPGPYRHVSGQRYGKYLRTYCAGKGDTFEEITQEESGTTRHDDYDNDAFQISAYRSYSTQRTR